MMVNPSSFVYGGAHIDLTGVAIHLIYTSVEFVNINNINVVTYPWYSQGPNLH